MSPKPTLYDTLGVGYARRRQPDPRIAALVRQALEGMDAVVNVGAGAGAYEPTDRRVVAVEPSARMIAQRPPGAAPCVQAVAERLPFADAAFDAALAILTLHHWSDWRAGLLELRRVARRRIVLLAFDVDAPPFWLVRDYLPALAALDCAIMPPLGALAAILGPAVETVVPVPHDCQDGFLGAYWRRPEAYLDPAARAAISSFARIDAAEGLARLARDLDDGAWAARNGDLLGRERLDVGYRLLTWQVDA